MTPANEYRRSPHLDSTPVKESKYHHPNSADGKLELPIYSTGENVPDSSVNRALDISKVFQAGFSVSKSLPQILISTPNSEMDDFG
jgi:hypothetical protein